MRTLINNKQLHVWLPDKLFNNLQGAVEEYNKTLPKVKINFTKAAYIMNLFFYLPLKYRDKYEYGWIPLCSDKLGMFKNYKRYIEFLQDTGFINKFVADYSTASNKCKRYNLADGYQNQSVALHRLSDNSYFIKTINKYHSQRERNANTRCGHLTKWLNPEDFTIDYKGAMSYIKKTYSDRTVAHKNMRNKRFFVIESIENKIWTYSREGKDDRLHSILTSLPKDIRRFVKYKGESLVSFDIKSSQPFIFSSILNHIVNPNINIIYNYIRKRDIRGVTSTMSDLFYNNLNHNELQRYIDLVQNGTFYEYFGEELYKKGLISKDIFGRCYLGKPKEIKNIWVFIHKRYNTLRDASKEITMQTTFSSENAHSKFIDTYMNMFPEVFKVIQFIKKDKEKNFFALLLQNIEANAVLDYCTKAINEKYPAMPLFTIHDSVITTTSYQDELEGELTRLLGMYFGLTPKLEVEYWSEQISKAS